MPLTIAIVDDDLAICEMLEDLLMEEGYQVECYSHSRSLFERLEQDIPALLILDLHLEHSMSGWEILTEIRSRPATATVSIIVSTADTQFVNQHLEQLQILNATLVDKPFEIETMIDTVTQVLEGQKT